MGQNTPTAHFWPASTLRSSPGYGLEQGFTRGSTLRMSRSPTWPSFPRGLQQPPARYAKPGARRIYRDKGVCCSWHMVLCPKSTMRNTPLFAWFATPWVTSNMGGRFSQSCLKSIKYKRRARKPGNTRGAEAESQMGVVVKGTPNMAVVLLVSR